MDTAEVFFHFEVEDNVDKDKIAQLLQERIADLEIVNVQEAEATPDETRLTGAEIAAGIALGIVIVRGTRELIEEINKLLPEIANLVSELKGLKNAFVEVEGEMIPIDKLDEDKLKKLAEER